FILLLLCTFSLSFLACKNSKDENSIIAPNTSQKEDVAVKNGRLAFKDRSTYESFITLPAVDTTNRQKTTSAELRTSATEIKYAGFTSMLDVYKNSNANNRLAGDTMTINDETLAALVNSDGILEIGEWICKINPAKSLVTVLNEADENMYQDLVNDVSNPKIYIFSTNDDVLDLLEDGQINGSSTNYRVSIFCGGGASGSSQQSLPGSANNQNFIGESTYKKFGVYFHLFTTCYFFTKNDNLTFQHQHAYYYKTNCKNYQESGPYLFTNDLRTGDYNFKSGGQYYDCIQNIYMSTRGLHDYIVYANYTYSGIKVVVPAIEGH
ncbi:hypothetical protein, partial [uncultured Cytophaga sp.]|uniref:hypothetical protein n=1 Tax=uncultured Cytophaga sp. TaxID=160238 RepID=UPI002627555A